MTDFDHAMADLAFIQERLTASTRFRGFAPVAVASTGMIAIVLATAQVALPETFGHDGPAFVVAWMIAAAIAGAIVAIEAIERARQLHGGLADRMMASTLRLLLPFGVASAAIGLVVALRAPATIWILPGVWQLLVALIGFSAVSMLPRAIVWPAGWYFGCGVATLMLGARLGVPTPWMMGVPFGVGQLITAAIFYRPEARDAR